jgi:hypothetical protein
MNRRDFVAVLAMLIPLKTIPKPEIIWVYYYDGPNFTPWRPKWERCLVRGDRALRLEGKGRFEMSHVRRHLYWVDDRRNARLNVPTDPGSRSRRPNRMPLPEPPEGEQ